jgi:hypothetical protein
MIAHGGKRSEYGKLVSNLLSTALCKKVSRQIQLYQLTTSRL